MEKEKLYAAVEAHASLLTGLSDKIWGLAELSLREYRSRDAYLEILNAQGFRVETNLAGIATAFSGSYGSGRPVIGILGEFDALSGLSQEAGATVPKPLTPGGCGHGCGHNLLGAASLGAAIALKEAIQAGDLPGTVVFYGCPGEEGCAGKAFMARDGAFRNLDAALCWHPGDTNQVTTGSCAASLQVEYTFTGVAAHAAGAPELGRSALDAAELMNVGANFLREHIDRHSALHYSFLDAGGVSPNVVQPTARVLYMLRGENVAGVKALRARLEKVAQGAALMTETTVASRQIDGTASTLYNPVLQALLQKNLSQVPLPVYTAEEWAYAEALKATYPSQGLPGGGVEEDPDLADFVAERSQNGTRALNDFLLPYHPSRRKTPGSTDVGDVSWLTPTAQFTAVTWPSGSPGHSWQNVAIGKSSVAHKGLLYAAKVLAGTAADLMTDPALRQQARAAFQKAAAGGYDCPIGKEVVPQL